MVSMWRDSPIMPFLFSLLICILVSILGIIIFIGVDSLGIETSPSNGVVVGRSYSPESTSVSYMKVGDVDVPQITTYPESWTAQVALEGSDSIDCPVTKEQYQRLTNGLSVQIMVGAGRLSGSAYCSGISS
ncbi:hypothetical protein [Rhizobium sp. MHM7A]|uniref:hypothetical protein n=1 Tax=Rhizobium sp. MHM7A TaxID=2583233 RepID=UPI001105F20E|nr:hypothetical protein [Rhizobium sp. MHM7A]TLX16087.1 hypothetical protein FFR93_01835 [Rhizobium sp. MHM7A]